MSSTGSDWGGDYSFLLQSIEGKISENLTDKNAILSIPSPFLSSSSAVKRKRLSSDAIQSDLRDDMNTGSAAKMRDQAVIDELTLENEQLRDQLERVKSESSISRDELLRQVKFYEEKSDALKKESQTRLDKYYEEKKKWQIKQRETDTALKKAVTELQLLQQQQRTASSASSSTSAVVDSTQKSRQQQEMVSQRLRELDIELRSKVEESRMNQVAKLNMANELLAAQQELKQLRSTCGAGSMASEALQEARALRTQLSELESVHKRTARDHETMKKKFRNQTLLEEELSSVKAKLRIAEETNLAHRHVQVEHQQLVEEKALWSQMFQEVVAETKKGLTVSNSGGGVGNTSETGSADSKSLASALLADDESGSVQDALSSASATPTQVLHLLSAYQRRCALLLQGQGHLQHTVSELRRQLRHSQSQLQESEQLRAQSEEALDKAQAQLRNAQQQNKLYDGEIQSLRSLLRTFDTEFEIGRPNEAKMLSIKEKMIEDLRGELDKCRQQAEEYVSRLRCTEQESAQQLETISGLQTQLEQANSAVERLSTTTTTTTTTDVPGEVTKTKDSEEEEKMTVAALRADLEEARSDLMCIQHATGLDYIPTNTRVLRLKDSLVSKVLPSSHPPYLVSTAASSNTTSSGGGTTPAAAAAASALPPRTTVPSVDAMQSIWKQLYLYLSNGGEANRSGSSSIDITSGDQNNNNNNNNNSNVDEEDQEDGDTIEKLESLSNLEAAAARAEAQLDDAAEAAMKLRAIEADIKKGGEQGKQAKKIRRFSVMGTLGYMAPEMVILLNNKPKPMYGEVPDPNKEPTPEKRLTKFQQRQGYGPGVDWWSMGVTLFKLLTGMRPFSDSDLGGFITLTAKQEALIAENAKFKEYFKLFKRIEFPDYVSKEAKDLILKLLDVNDKTRLGSGKKGVRNIKSHPFFASIDWSKMELKHMEPPFRPDPFDPDDDLFAYPDLESLLAEHGKSFWFDTSPPVAQQKYFYDWDFTSPHTIRVEAGLSSMMEQYDRNFKVRQIMGSRASFKGNAGSTASKVSTGSSESAGTFANEARAPERPGKPPSNKR